jgi:hypothetical protein
MKKTTLQKLSIIRKKATVYEIVFRNAGVALMFFELEKLSKEEQIKYFAVDRPAGDKVLLLQKALVVYKYYPTLPAAIDAEYKRLVGGTMN